MTDKKQSLGNKSIVMLAILGIILFIGTGLAAGIQLYRYDLNRVRSAAESYVNMLCFQIGFYEIDDILLQGDKIHELYEMLSAYQETDEGSGIDEETSQIIGEEVGEEALAASLLWNEIDLFVLGLGNYCKDIKYAYVVIPEENDLVYVWDSDHEGGKNAAPFEHLPYSEKEKEHIMAVMRGDAESDFFTETVGGELIGTALAPVTHDGKIWAVAAIDVSFSKTQKACQILLSHIGLAILLIMLVSITVYHYLFRKQVISPIKVISDSMIRFARDSRTKPQPLNIRSRDEIGEIAESYEKMTEDISTYVRNIEVLTWEKVENNVELEVARRIQNGLVPEQFCLGEEGYLVHAMTRPARTVGGDFYDCFRQGEDSVCVFMGDVSGKGISAAIFMAMTKTIIREKLIVGLDPAEALNQANNELYAQNPEFLFATVFAAVLNLQTGELRYANAGHTLPVMLKDEPEYLNPDSGIALGVVRDAQIQDGRVCLENGEGILLYTDGVTEAMNLEGDFFGTDRLLDAIRMAPDGVDANEDVLVCISRAVGRFTEGREPFDDMAVLALYRVAAME